MRPDEIERAARKAQLPPAVREALRNADWVLTNPEVAKVFAQSAWVERQSEWAAELQQLAQSFLASYSSQGLIQAQRQAERLLIDFAKARPPDKLTTEVGEFLADLVQTGPILPWPDSTDSDARWQLDARRPLKLTPEAALQILAIIVSIIAIVIQLEQGGSMSDTDAQRIVKQAIEQVQAEQYGPHADPLP